MFVFAWERAVGRYQYCFMCVTALRGWQTTSTSSGVDEDDDDDDDLNVNNPLHEDQRTPTHHPRCWRLAGPHRCNLAMLETTKPKLYIAPGTSAVVPHHRRQTGSGKTAAVFVFRASSLVP